MDGKVKALLEYIARSIHGTSALLGPVSFHVEAIGLLDEIGRLWSISKPDVGAVVNPIRETIERERG